MLHPLLAALLATEPPTNPPSAPRPPQSPPVSCPCLSTYPTGMPLNGGRPILTISGTQHEYHDTYGLLNCSVHDAGSAPFCDTTGPGGEFDPASNPPFCSQSWCYVNASECNVASALSAYVSASVGLSYSYEGCSGVNAFSEYYQAVQPIAPPAPPSCPEGAIPCVYALGGSVCLVPLLPTECDRVTDRRSWFFSCDQVAPGGYCEADGECATDTQLNNCAYDGSAVAYDMYYVVVPLNAPNVPPLPPSPPTPPSTPPVFCLDDPAECPYTSNGNCNDGGPGAETQHCPYGTDCSDCGPRVVVSPPRPPSPPTPPVMPPPPLAPHPPAAPPGVCLNTCDDGPAPLGTPGKCDEIDPRLGSRWGGADGIAIGSGRCDPGTDCDDCGVGIFCVGRRLG